MSPMPPPSARIEPCEKCEKLTPVKSDKKEADSIFGAAGVSRRRAERNGRAGSSDQQLARRKSSVAPRSRRPAEMDSESPACLNCNRCFRSPARPPEKRSSARPTLDDGARSALCELEAGDWRNQKNQGRNQRGRGEESEDHREAGLRDGSDD